MKAESTKKNSERVTIVMPAAEARRLKHLAIDEGRSTSAIARDALRKHMDAGVGTSQKGVAQ